MPTCIFILSRFTLRVDNVLFRARDTRIYHSFSSAPPLVVRETRGWEAPYERVKRVTPFFTFLSSRVLTNANLLPELLMLPLGLCVPSSSRLGPAAARRSDAVDGP